MFFCFWDRSRYETGRRTDGQTDG